MMIHYITQKTFLLLLFTDFQYIGYIKKSCYGSFEIDGKKMIKMPKKGEYVRFKNY